MAAQFDTEINTLLDRLVPVCQFARRSRPRDPRFDKECRHATRHTRRLRRAYIAATRAHVAVAFAVAVSPSTSVVSDAVASANLPSIAAADAVWCARRYLYRQLLEQKRGAHWRKRIEISSKQLCRTVDSLHGRGRPPVNTNTSADQFTDYFAGKVAAVRLATQDALVATFEEMTGHSLSDLSPVSSDGVNRLSDMSSAAGVPVMRQVAAELAQFFTELHNVSLAT
jgi:hypothetical protein